METCLFCGGDLKFHCPRAGADCEWLKCVDCQATIDPIQLRAFDKTGKRLEVPTPD